MFKFNSCIEIWAAGPEATMSVSWSATSLYLSMSQLLFTKSYYFWQLITLHAHLAAKSFPN